MKREWQSIETAPHDGTNVLTFVKFASVSIVHISFYRSKEEWFESGQYCGGWDTIEEWVGWWTYPQNSVSQVKLVGFTAPTHWMPLPEAPE